MFSIETRHSLTLVNDSYPDIDKPLRIKQEIIDGHVKRMAKWENHIVETWIFMIELRL